MDMQTPYTTCCRCSEPVPLEEALLLFREEVTWAGIFPKYDYYCPSCLLRTRHTESLRAQRKLGIALVAGMVALSIAAIGLGLFF
jgi:hypothetical protein